MRKGCQYNLASVMDLNKMTPKLKDMKVVRDFVDVFPKNSLEYPRIVKCSWLFNWISRVILLSKTPYSMALVELKEFKEQFQELLDKKFIRLSDMNLG